MTRKFRIFSGAGKSEPRFVGYLDASLAVRPESMSDTLPHSLRIDDTSIYPRKKKVIIMYTFSRVKSTIC